MPVHYDQNFYKARTNGSQISAENVLPIIIDICNPQSVIDLGCGIGNWLSVFKNKFGVTDILGVDGKYVDINMLKIARSEFAPHNLEQLYIASKKYDLAMSVEVGEHLPDSSADNLVKSLTDASDVVMFSAALPGQTGTYHINEQPPEYWAKKFIKRGYVCIDCIRKQIWNNPSIDVWYRQNILLFIKADVYETKYKEKLGAFKDKTDPEFLTRAHPDLLIYFKDKYYQTRSMIGFLKYHLAPLKKMITGENRK